MSSAPRRWKALTPKVTDDDDMSTSVGHHVDDDDLTIASESPEAPLRLILFDLRRIAVHLAFEWIAFSELQFSSSCISMATV